MNPACPSSSDAGHVGDGFDADTTARVALGALTDIAQFGEIMRHLPDAVVVTDDCGIVVWGNDAMADLIEDTLDRWPRSLVSSTRFTQTVDLPSSTRSRTWPGGRQANPARCSGSV